MCKAARVEFDVSPSVEPWRAEESAAMHKHSHTLLSRSRESVRACR
jgi:hypothetical protein